MGQTFYSTATSQLYVCSGLNAQGISVWQQASVVPTEAAQQIVSPIINCTGNVGDISGADDCFLILTANGKQNLYTTRTAAQLFADIPGCIVGFGYAISIAAGGTATVTIIPGTGITVPTLAPVVGSILTIPPGTLRQYILTFTSTTTATLQSCGSGPWP